MSRLESNVPALIECPMRGRVVSSTLCDFCDNRIRVLFRSEVPPELRCGRWDWACAGRAPDPEHDPAD
jgi:hypothetical protein